MTVPAAPLLNVLMFWMPFGGVSHIRVALLKKRMMEATGKKKCDNPAD